MPFHGGRNFKITSEEKPAKCAELEPSAAAIHLRSVVMNTLTPFEMLCASWDYMYKYVFTLHFILMFRK